MAVRPAAGPLTLVFDPLRNPTNTPPMIPERIPEKSGAPEASAIPRQSGSATRNTVSPASKSLWTELNFEKRLVSGGGISDSGVFMLDFLRRPPRAGKTVRCTMVREQAAGW